MAKTLEAHLNAEGKKFALVVSRFNDFITDKSDAKFTTLVMRSARSKV